MAKQIYSIGVVGARGYAGAELIALINAHPNLMLAYAASRSKIGDPVPGTDGRVFQDADPQLVASMDADAVVLAVPDGATNEYLAGLRNRIVVDLSSDHRFDDGWIYGLSELNSVNLIGATRIANPGCYATALQLAAAPLLHILEGPIHAFGVSGYSGAGATPSNRNDPELLAEGLTPYKLVGHTHEREATRHLAHPVRFTPHVAPYFRGITLTMQAKTQHAVDVDGVIDLYSKFYNESGLIEVLRASVPRVQDIAHKHGVCIGGICVGDDKRSIAMICVIDNLLKGASSQAVQNLNLALGLPMNTGLKERVFV